MIRARGLGRSYGTKRVLRDLDLDVAERDVLVVTGPNGSGLPRSWMVWSNGHCPACRKPVPMYDWQIDAIDRRTIAQSLAATWRWKPGSSVWPKFRRRFYGSPRLRISRRSGQLRFWRFSR